MPQLEEIEDIDDVDNMDFDLAEFDPSLKTPIAPARPKPKVERSQDSEPQNDPFAQMMANMGMKMPEMPVNPGPMPGMPDLSDMPEPTAEEMARFKSLNIIYPCYFDKNRSVKQGRRVPLDKCIANPLAKTILDACRFIRLRDLVFEPEKTHPQDYGNPET
ncbi:unnamed protein product [Ambrosiozyma monospora]|uniref:Unnamed protein product n=1 Tax=Ambrosiozyma monospora TaxID=43982 RepID=A0A9W6T8P0_AMBMO|nr:unnamed protein product [Ambrosiozyma monospora]